jgi:hypothetical protein
MLVSQVLTIYTTPVIYLYLDRISLKLSSLGKKKTPANAPTKPVEASPVAWPEVVSK